MRCIIKLLAIAVLALPSAIVPAQDLGSFLKDSKYPQKIKPVDLGEDMKAVRITHEKQGGGADIFSMMMNPMMMMMGAFGKSAESIGEKTEDPQQAPAMAFFDRMGISWTNGSTVKLYDETFLVTYSVQINMAQVMGAPNPPDLSKTDLTLTLINTKAIASITPRPDMTKEEWMKPAPVGGQGSIPAEGEPESGGAKAQTISNLKQVAIGALMYSADYDDQMPYVQSTKGAYEVLMPYFKSMDIVKSMNPNGARFLLNMAIAGTSMSIIEMPAETILFYEDKEWPDGVRAVAFCDGHVKLVKPEDWDRYKASLSLKLQKNGRPLPATLGSNIGGG